LRRRIICNANSGYTYVCITINICYLQIYMKGISCIGTIEGDKICKIQRVIYSLYLKSYLITTATISATIIKNTSIYDNRTRSSQGDIINKITSSNGCCSICNMQYCSTTSSVITFINCDISNFVVTNRNPT